MLEIFGWAVGGLLMNWLGGQPARIEAAPLVSWQRATIFELPTQPDPRLATLVQDYLQGLAKQGFPRDRQGIWVQSQWAELANHQASTPLSAASLSKIATTLAALETWGADHHFETTIYGTGPIQAGILQGDLVIEGKGDPLFVWEEAIALGNALQQLGIRQVKGNLIITGNFAMNFQVNPQGAGELLKQGLNDRLWSPAVEKQYKTLPPGTNRPQIAIAGTVEVKPSLPEQAQLLLRHQSLPLVEILKQMNIYSNNEMAEMLAQSVGGAQTVARIASQVAKVPPSEIQLVNGSGLSVNNRISPRAVCQMLMALEHKLDGHSLKVADLFPVTGRDRQGTMQWRHLPAGLTVKTGTLAQVSALAGVISTQERGLVWFAIINSGSHVDKFRAEQDRLLQQVAQHWTIVPPSTLVAATDVNRVYLGDPQRNLEVK
jgi:D-alanyl-D-alanine carboxypeptidase/D-alanyl-D-alanine-endopeptidase (penicillin-binding protein 4)